MQRIYQNVDNESKSDYVTIQNYDATKGINDFLRMKLILVSLGVNASIINPESHFEKDLLLTENKRVQFFEMAEAYLSAPIFYQESVNSIDELLKRVAYARAIGI